MPADLPQDEAEPTGFGVTLMLCDHAVVAEGKLYINGGGWTTTGPQTAASAVAVLLLVPWGRANTQIHFRLQLLHEDGHPVLQPGLDGPGPIQADGSLEVGRPAGLKHGSPLPLPLALTIPPLTLPPASRFTWVLLLDGVPAGHLAFETRPA